MTDVDDRFYTACSALFFHGNVQVHRLTVGVWQAALLGPDGYPIGIVEAAMALYSRVFGGKPPAVGDIMIIADAIQAHGLDATRKAARTWSHDVAAENRGRTHYPTRPWFLEEARLAKTSAPGDLTRPALTSRDEAPSDAVRAKMASGMSRAAAEKEEAAEVLAALDAEMGTNLGSIGGKP